jgi:hypothetical protein
LLIEELLKEPYLSSGTRGKWPASSSGTAGGGKPTDNVPDGSSRKSHRATPAIYADERNLRKRRYYRRGKWLTPSSQNGMAAGSLGS